MRINSDRRVVVVTGSSRGIEFETALSISPDMET